MNKRDWTIKNDSEGRMQSLKLSWSIISAWSAGRQDDAIQMLMGTSQRTNEYMREGTRIHNEIAKQKLKLLPFMQDTGVFEGIREEGDMTNYFRVQFSEWLDMSMVIDYLDVENGLIIDWKSGTRNSTQHNKMQLYVYAMLLAIEGIHINKAVIAKVYEDEGGEIFASDFSMYAIDENKMMLAANYVESNASEIFNFIQESRDAKGQEVQA